MIFYFLTGLVLHVAFYSYLTLKTGKWQAAWWGPIVDMIGWPIMVIGWLGAGFYMHASFVEELCKELEAAKRRPSVDDLFEDLKAEVIEARELH